MSGPATAGTTRVSAGRVVLAWVKEIAIVVIGALIASTLLRLFIAQMFVIPSGSMEQTLMVRDRVAVQKLVGFERGDIVVFRDTQGWLARTRDEADPIRKALIFVGLAPDESANHLIKRVIGVPGDHVTCCDAQGRILVNGVPLDEELYLYPDEQNGGTVDPSMVKFDVVVPRDHVFVMGDHRNNSQDSRCHLSDEREGEPVGAAAFIPTENIVGTAVAVVFPFSRIRGITRPETFEAVPDAVTAPEEPIITGPRVNC